MSAFFGGFFGGFFGVLVGVLIVFIFAAFALNGKDECHNCEKESEWEDDAKP